MKLSPKSVVREIRTLRSVGAGGGQLPPATRSAEETGLIPDIGAPVYGVRDWLTIHAETSERPVWDQNSAVRAANSNGRFWPDSDRH